MLAVDARDYGAKLPVISYVDRTYYMTFGEPGIVSCLRPCKIHGLRSVFVKSVKSVQ